MVYCFGNIIVSDNGAITITSRMSSRWEHWKVFPTERAEPFWMFGKVLDAAATRDVSVLDYYFRWALAHGYEFMKSTFRTWESYCE